MQFRDWTYGYSDVFCVFLKVRKQILKRRRKIKTGWLVSYWSRTEGIITTWGKCIPVHLCLKWPPLRVCCIPISQKFNIVKFNIAPCKGYCPRPNFTYLIICCKGTEKPINSGLIFICPFLFCQSLVVWCFVIQGMDSIQSIISLAKNS